MDGSEISLSLISGSETTVEQLIKQIYSVNKKVFSLLYELAFFTFKTKEIKP